MENIIITDVTIKQRNVLTELLNAGKFTTSEIDDSFGDKRSPIDKIDLFPHFYYSEGRLVGFIHACFYEPEFKEQYPRFTEWPQVPFHEFIDSFK